MGTRFITSKAASSYESAMWNNGSISLSLVSVIAGNVCHLLWDFYPRPLSPRLLLYHCCVYHTTCICIHTVHGPRTGQRHSLRSCVQSSVPRYSKTMTMYVFAELIWTCAFLCAGNFYIVIRMTVVFWFQTGSLIITKQNRSTTPLNQKAVISLKTAASDI